MRNKINFILQMSAVFIGTIVGAGLASGQEITQFFSSYGIKSFWGILLCCLIYILIGNMIIRISIKHKLNSYNELISLVSPGFLGKATDFLMSFFLISGAAIILAGSGALLHQYFGISKWVGILFMALISLITLLRDTKGLVTINSFIVPSLTIVIITVFIMYLFFYKDILSVAYVRNITSYKSIWPVSALLYAGFNILSCSGVLVPLSNEVKDKKVLIPGLTIGAIGLTILSAMINLMLILNIPYIFKYEVPLLYIANRFGPIIQIMLLIIMWLEMFSTEVSDIYSIGKTLEHVFNISYKKSIFLVIIIAVPISQIGFTNLIKFLYPGFGVVSILFMIQCIMFYIKDVN